MQPFSPLTNALFAAALCFALGIAVLMAIATSASNVVALLPANVLLIAAMIFLSSAGWRVVVLLLCALTFAVVEAGHQQPLVAAAAFAFANAAEMLIACHLIRRFYLLRGTDDPRQGEQRREFVAEFDDLTGLVSRARLHELVETAVRLRYDGIALLFVDLDNFKYVNATLGHRAGDLLLKTIAERLRGSVRAQDVVARIGGDEFAILLIDGLQPAAAEAIARRIAVQMDAPIAIGTEKIRVGASIGVASWQPGSIAADDLLRCAEIALHRTKSTNRGSFNFFEPDMDKPLRERQELEQDLRQAFAEQDFDVYYQPIVHIATNEVVGFEALARWQHGTRGPVSPAEFIPIAEDVGLIASIGDWVLRRACRDAVQWPEHVKVSVNFSRAQFESTDAKLRLAAALSDAGLPAKRLQLEITETTVMADIDRANMLLDEFREVGVEIAMDDFGTGYSSLSCLRNCPFDRLKIDRAFIRDLTTSLEARAILRMVVHLASTLGMGTTAEGVETAEQYEIVKEEGCGEIQGFFFSAAKTAEDVLAYFQSLASDADVARKGP